MHHPGFTAKLRNGRGRGRNIRRTSQFHNWAINRTAVGLALCPVCVLVVARRRLCDSSVFRALRTDNGIQAKQRPRNCHPRHDGATRSGALNWGLPSATASAGSTAAIAIVPAGNRRSFFLLFLWRQHHLEQAVHARRQGSASREVDVDEIIPVSRYHIHKCFSEGLGGTHLSILEVCESATCRQMVHLSWLLILEVECDEEPYHGQRASASACRWVFWVSKRWKIGAEPSSSLSQYLDYDRTR